MATTELFRSKAPFPRTDWGLVQNVGNPSDPAFRGSMEQLATIYWKPICGYLCRRWGKTIHEATDLTQSFFLTLVQKGFPLECRSERGRFRSYVLASLDNLVRLEHRNATALKRGGRAVHVPIQPEDSTARPSGESPEKVFRHEWAGSLLQQALRDLEQECRAAGKDRAFEAFLLRDVHPPGGVLPSYTDLSERFRLSVDDVRNNLHRIRNRFRQLVWNRVRQTVGSDLEAEAELRDLFQAVRP
jgi:RNA polymerase sigma-70 factor (ECF subfamily)